MFTFKKQTKPLNGEIEIFGDEEFSYLSLIVASFATTKSRISNLSESKNILNFIDIMNGLGFNIKKNLNNIWEVSEGKKISQPNNVIDIKNSENTLYSLIPLLSTYNFKTFFKCDSSLNENSLEKIFNIFSKLGVSFNARNDKNMPFLMVGNNQKKSIKYEINNYNHILKNILLVATLNTVGSHEIIEHEKSSNHLEVLMKYFNIMFEEHDIGNKDDFTTKIGNYISINGGQTYPGKDVSLPSDTLFSSFVSVLGVLVPDSNITCKNVLINRHRDAFFRTLIDMGAKILFLNQRIVCGEKIADINIQYSKLKNTVVPVNRLYMMIKEFPSLVFLSSIANVNIDIQGINFLKSECLADYKNIIFLLKELSVNFKEQNNSLKITGGCLNFNKKLLLKEKMESPAVLLIYAMFGLFLDENVKIDSSIEESFPNLKNLFQKIGINIE